MWGGGGGQKEDAPKHVLCQCTSRRRTWGTAISPKNCSVFPLKDQPWTRNFSPKPHMSAGSQAHTRRSKTSSRSDLGASPRGKSRPKGKLLRTTSTSQDLCKLLYVAAQTSKKSLGHNTSGQRELCSGCSLKDTSAEPGYCVCVGVFSSRHKLPDLLQTRARLRGSVHGFEYGIASSSAVQIGFG